MLSVKLKFTLIVAVLVFFAIILALLKNKRLALKYTLLWMLTGFIMLILAIFPGIVTKVSMLLGIQSTMNGLFLFLIAFMIMILMSLTSIVSAQTERIRKLAQANAILEERVRKMEQERSDKDEICD